VAAHFLSNPEVPYLTLLPLSAAAADSPPDASLLVIGDVRKADFAACELVVLSGCATGAPYAEGTVTGPGFGDAFLDAGARAVVQTFWAVPDDAAAATMSEFIRLCRKDDVPVPRAISQVRRGEMRGPDGIRHPYHWAAFCIKLAHLQP
jgi:CHAT domain-containing protein